MENTNAHIQTIEAIKNNEVYKKILADSCGGIIYTEGTQTDYNTAEILKLWGSLPETYKEAAGGIIKGLFNFLNHN